MTFSTITELPGYKAHREQLDILRTRYEFAKAFCAGKRVLEVACGPGVGLGYIASVADSVDGCDIDDNILSFARDTYKGRKNISSYVLAAESIGDLKNRFDVVICFEAIYYFRDLPGFLSSLRRRLAPGGVVLLSTVNKDWDGFIPSPYSTRYYGLRELCELADKSGYEVEAYAVHCDRRTGVKSRVIGSIRRVASRFHLVPRTMRGKEIWKRVFYGKLSTIPRELTEKTGTVDGWVPTTSEELAVNYKFLYLVCRPRP